MGELTVIVERLLALIPDADEAQLELLAEMALEEAMEYCRLETYNSKLNTAVTKMVVQNYNRLGSEGVSSQSYSGVSETFVEGYSADIIALLNKNRRVRML